MEKIQQFVSVVEVGSNIAKKWKDLFIKVVLVVGLKKGSVQPPVQVVFLFGISFITV